VVKNVILELERDHGHTIPMDQITTKAVQMDLSTTETLEAIEKLKRAGDLFSPKFGFITKI